MYSSSVSVDFAVRWRSAGGVAAARPGNQWSSAWNALRHRRIRRLVAWMVAAIFLPAVTAMLVCEVECITQALASGGKEHAEPRFAAHQTLHSSVDQPDPQQGACHLAAALLIAVAATEASAVLRAHDQWVPDAELRFASLIWPPPQQRPKANGS